MVLNVKGAPANPRPRRGDGVNREEIESSSRPHAREEPTYDPNEGDLDMPGLPEPAPREHTREEPDVEKLDNKRGLRLDHEDFKKYGYG